MGGWAPNKSHQPSKYPPSDDLSVTRLYTVFYSGRLMGDFFLNKFVPGAKPNSCTPAQRTATGWLVHVTSPMVSPFSPERCPIGCQLCTILYIYNICVHFRRYALTRRSCTVFFASSSIRAQNPQFSYSNKRRYYVVIGIFFTKQLLRPPNTAGPRYGRTGRLIYNLLNT